MKPWSLSSTHGAIARATFNAQIGGKVLMTLKYGNKSVPFGAIVTHGENKNGSIVMAENGQVYLTGLLIGAITGFMGQR